VDTAVYQLHARLVTLLQQSRPDLKLTQIALKLFTPAEALELFRKLLGKRFKPEHEQHYQDIAALLGHLPVALRLAANLMLLAPNFSPAELHEQLNQNLLATLDEAEAEGLDLWAPRSVFDLSGPSLTSFSLFVWRFGRATQAEACATFPSFKKPFR